MEILKLTDQYKNQNKRVAENAKLCFDELDIVRKRIETMTSLADLVEMSRLENTKCEQKKADCEQKREECIQQRSVLNQLLNERFRKAMVDKQPRKDLNTQL